MDKIKQGVQDFKDPQGQTGVKGVESEGKTAAANYKKDQGNQGQFVKDEAQAFKGASDKPM